MHLAGCSRTPAWCNNYAVFVYIFTEPMHKYSLLMLYLLVYRYARTTDIILLYIDMQWAGCTRTLLYIDMQWTGCTRTLLYIDMHWAGCTRTPDTISPSRLWMPTNQLWIRIRWKHYLTTINSKDILYTDMPHTSLVKNYSCFRNWYKISNM